MGLCDFAVISSNKNKPSVQYFKGRKERFM